MRAAFHAEVLKITTVRGLWLGAVLATVAVPLFSLLVVGTGGLGVEDTATSGAATGTIVGSARLRRVGRRRSSPASTRTTRSR